MIKNRKCLILSIILTILAVSLVFCEVIDISPVLTIKSDRPHSKGELDVDILFDEDEDASILVKLSDISSLEVIMDFEILSATAIDGYDFISSFSTVTHGYSNGDNGKLRIPSGDIEGKITIPLIDDNMTENDEYFKVILNNLVNATFENNATTLICYVYIMDNDENENTFYVSGLPPEFSNNDSININVGGDNIYYYYYSIEKDNIPYKTGINPIDIPIKIDNIPEAQYILNLYPTNNMGEPLPNYNPINHTWTIDTTEPIVLFQFPEKFDISNMYEVLFNEIMDKYIILKLEVYEQSNDTWTQIELQEGPDKDFTKEWVENPDNGDISSILHIIFTEDYFNDVLLYYNDYKLRLEVNDRAGNELIYYIHEIPQQPVIENYYVNSTTGDDFNDGLSESSPKKTIKNAFTTAVDDLDPDSYTIIEIKISGGNYVESDLILGENVRLIGGYNPNDWTHRDYETFPTIINNGDFTNGSIDNILGTISSDYGNLYIDGLTLYSNNLDYNAGLYIENTYAIIVNSNIIGGDNTIHSFGLYSMNSNYSIVESKIKGGDNVDYSYAVYAENIDIPVFINNEIIAGDSTQESYGIHITNFYSQNGANFKGNVYSSSKMPNNPYNPMMYDSIIINNIIDGGKGDIYSSGIYYENILMDNQDPGNGDIFIYPPINIYNNTINGGTGDEVYSIRLKNTETFIINNILFNTSSSIPNNIVICNENSVNDNQGGDYLIFISINNNNLFGSHSGVYRYIKGTQQYDYLSINDLYAIDFVNHIVDDNTSHDLINGNGFIDFTNLDWHLSNNTPNDVKQDGLDLYDLGYIIDTHYTNEINISLTNDKDGTPRTAVNNNPTGWSMGAYEQDN